MNLINILLSIILPLVFNLIITPIILAYANKHKLFDAKDHRKTHIGDIPRLGGIGLFVAMILSSAIIYFITLSYVSLAFYIAISLIFLSGIVDDIKPIRAYIKLLAQIAATLVLIAGGHTLSHIFIPFINYNLYLGVFQYPITLIWIIGITNSINLLDGMDGQAGGVSAIAAISIGIVAIVLGEGNVAVICFVLAGALLGFLQYNYPPAKIFMGDGGSLTIGFILAAIPLLFNDPNSKGKLFLVAIAVLLIPIFDVFAAIIRRSKLKISFFEPDRGHIHHKFTDFTSLSTRQILLVIYSISVMSGIFSILFIYKTTIITELGLFLNIIIHIVLFTFLHKRKKSRS